MNWRLHGTPIVQSSMLPVPPMLIEGSAAGTPITVIDMFFVYDALFVSRAVIWKLNLPTALGVPEMTPVVGLMLMPSALRNAALYV